MPSFKEYLAEINAMQAARYAIQPRTSRMQNAQQSDREARMAMTQDIERMEKSPDAEEKLLARKMKEVAMLQMKIDAKKKKQNMVNQQQPGNVPGQQMAPAGTAF